MTLLTFKNKYIVQTTSPIATTSATFVDDTTLAQTFSLSSSQTVLAIYQCYGSGSGYNAMGNAINIDGSDLAISYDSSTTAISRNSCFWVGTLSAGPHTIKGRFSVTFTPQTMTLGNRILLIYIFDGNEFRYLDVYSSTATSKTYLLANDPYGSVTITPSSSCKALYLYNCSNVWDATENGGGKIAFINVAGTDYSQAEKSPLNNNRPASIFTCYANSLSPVSTTVTGRFQAVNSANYVTINYRQLGVLLLDNSTLLDSASSDSQVYTYSNALVNDIYATISRTTTDTRELFSIAYGTKRYATSDGGYGQAYGISVDSVDRQLQRAAPNFTGSAPRADSATTVWAQTLSGGAHTIQGRYSNNYDATLSYLDSRRMFALWLSIPYGSLNISSNPSDADIYIDNVHQTGKTPILLTNLTIGIHTYKLTKTGYQDAIGDFTITGGGTTYVSPLMIPSTGSLNISSTPSGTRIYIDDIDRGINTPNTISNLAPGSHNVKLTLVNYNDYITTITILSNQTTTINPTLTLSTGSTKIQASPSFVQPSYTGEIIDVGTLKVDWNGTGTIILEKTIVYDRLVLTGPNGTFDHTWIPCGAIVPEGPFDITSIFTPGYNEINVKIYNVCGGNIGTETGSIDITGPITLTCPITPKYSGNTITLQATPKDGIGPYYVEFRKNGVTIDPSRLEGLDNPIIGATEDIQITRIYTLDDVDVASASSGTIDFEVFMSDSCPTEAKTCDQICTINIGCLAPVCNFTVT